MRLEPERLEPERLEPERLEPEQPEPEQPEPEQPEPERLEREYLEPAVGAARRLAEWKRESPVRTARHHLGAAVAEASPNRRAMGRKVRGASPESARTAAESRSPPRRETTRRVAPRRRRT